MIFRALLFLTVTVASVSVMAAEGLVTLSSPHSAAATMDRLETAVRDKGLTVFARIDHAAGARKIGEALRPTEVILFGNPRGGTPFMQCAQTAGIDLPLKALVWEDADGQVWLGYNDPVYLAQRHEVPDCAVAGRLATVLRTLAESAVAP